MARTKGKIGNVVKKRNGWLMRITFEGIRMSKMAHGARTKREAEKVMLAWYTDLEAGREPLPNQQTLTIYYGFWLRDIRTSIAPSTHRSYRVYFEKHVRPYLGGLKLQAIKKRDIEKLRDHMIEKKLCYDTIRLTLLPLKKALQEAVDRDNPVLSRNPAKGVILKRSMVKAERKPKKKALEQFELGQYLNALEGHKWGLLFELIALTGLRIGEARALQWSDIDFQRRLLHVRASVSTGKIGRPTATAGLLTKAEYVLSSTKTGEERTIELPAHLFEKLKAEHAKAGSKPGKHGLNLIFHNGRGDFTDYRSLLECHKRLCENAGIDGNVTLHSLRHTCVTLLNAYGANGRAIRNQVGHSTAGRITEEVYTHMLPSMRTQAAEMLSQIRAEALMAVSKPTGEDRYQERYQGRMHDVADSEDSF